MEENKYNFVDRNGNIIYDSWFNCELYGYKINGEFYGTVYWLFYNDEYKILTTKKGKQIYTEGDGLFKDVRYIDAGISHKLLEVQRRDGLLNIVVGNNLISTDWFKVIGDFHYYDEFGNGLKTRIDFAKVQRDKDKLWNYLTKEGKILYPQEWFYACPDFYGERVKVYNAQGLENILTKEGKMLFDEWHRGIS